jgi:hypothetical protein
MPNDAITRKEVAGRVCSRCKNTFLQDWLIAPGFPDYAYRTCPDCRVEMGFVTDNSDKQPDVVEQMNRRHRLFLAGSPNLIEEDDKG